MQFLKVIIQKTFKKFIADQLDSLAEERRDALPLDYLEGIVEVIDYSFIVLVVVGPRIAVVALVVDIAHGLGSVAGDDERRRVVWQAGSIWQCDDLVIIDHVDVFLFNLGIAARVSRFKLQIGIDECLEQPKYCEVAGVPEFPAEEGDNPLHFLIEVALLGQQPEMLLYTFAVPLQELAVPEPAQEVHEAVDIHPPALVGIDCPKRWSALFFHSRIYIYTNLILAEVGRGIYNFNMDYFLIFRFEVLEGAENAGRLESLEAELVRQEEEKYGGSSKMQFTNLTFATNFRQAMLAILKKMQDINNNFVNIQLVCEDTSLFTHILPAEFSARSLAMPYCLTNFVDWRAVCRQKYGCVSRTLQETAKFLNLMELSDADVILKLLLRKLRQEKAIVDTEVAFVRRFESKQVASENFAYFRCIGLPFQISKNELVQRMIEPQRFNIKNYGLSLIFEHGKFSGKAVLKVPAEFAEMVLRKDRMYIGRRYVQISTIGRQDFEGYKMREQRQRQESRGREARPERSSSSSQSRSRSREKLEIHSLLNEAAVKVRGLPYSLNSWDIEQIFKRFNFVRGSIKLGFLGQRKSGEAVILFPNREEAERAMHLQGFVVQGRYLELKVITKQNYDRFK